MGFLDSIGLGGEDAEEKRSLREDIQVLSTNIEAINRHLGFDDADSANNAESLSQIKGDLVYLYEALNGNDQEIFDAITSLEEKDNTDVLERVDETTSQIGDLTDALRSVTQNLQALRQHMSDVETRIYDRLDTVQARFEDEINMLREQNDMLREQLFPDEQQN